MGENHIFQVFPLPKFNNSTLLKHYLISLGLSPIDLHNTNNINIPFFLKYMLGFLNLQPTWNIGKRVSTIKWNEFL
jgi:hypothetical protein